MQKNQCYYPPLITIFANPVEEKQFTTIVKQTIGRQDPFVMALAQECCIIEDMIIPKNNSNCYSLVQEKTLTR